MAITLENDHGADERAALKAAVAAKATVVTPELLGEADFSDRRPWNELTNEDGVVSLDPQATFDEANPGEVETTEQTSKRVRECLTLLLL